MAQHLRSTALLAVGLSLVALPVEAGDPATGTGAHENESAAWAGLDAEIAALQGGFRDREPHFRWGTVLRTEQFHTNFGAGGDTSGHQLTDAEIWIEFDVQDWGIRYETDLRLGDPVLQDAYVKYDVEDWFTFKAGSVLAPFVRSGALRPDTLLFPDRTIIGRTFNVWDEGLLLEGAFQSTKWAFGVQNGTDDVGDNLLYTGRLEWQYNGGMGAYESVIGRDEWNANELRGSVGLAWYDEQRFAQGTIYVLDAAFTDGIWFFGAEYLDVGRDLVDLEAVGVALPTLGLAGSSNPWALSAAYALGPDLELGLRYEDLDDGLDTTSYGAGLNWYYAGTGLRFQLAYTNLDGDQVDASFVEAGVVLSAGR